MSDAQAPRTNRSLFEVLGDPALLRRTALPFLIFFFVLGNLGIARWEKLLQAQRRANLLQRDASDPDAKGAVVRYDWSVGEDLPRFLRHIPSAEATPLVILAGMSQMYAINDGKPGDLTIVEHLDNALAPKGVRAFGVAAPNLSNEEAVFLLSALLMSPRTKPDVFLYGVCFDKFRNVDLRPAFAQLLREMPGLRERYRAAAEKYATQYPLAAQQLKISLSAPIAEKNVEAETTETRLRALSGRVVPAVAARSDLNAILQIELFALRNAVFRIKASTKRPILEARYELNKELLALLIEMARDAGVLPILYVIPLNAQADTPYIASQYEDFKRWVSMLADEKKVAFSSLEGAVPAEDWGLSDGEPDFKHFRAAGHQKTAQAILAAFGPLLSSPRHSTREGSETVGAPR